MSRQENFQSMMERFSKSEPVLDDYVISIVRQDLGGIVPTYELVRAILQRRQLRQYYSHITAIIRHFTIVPQLNPNITESIEHDYTIVRDVYPKPTKRESILNYPRLN